MNEELISQRVACLFRWPFPGMGDNPLVERVWDRLDHALAQCRLEAHDEVTATGTIRVVTVLGLFQIWVNLEIGQVWAYYIKDDGTFREIDEGFHLYCLFHHPRCWTWWLRFAFMRWEPASSRIDFVKHPHSRPCGLELDASRRLVRRLNLDRRYWTLAQDFDAALGISPLALSMMEEKSEENSCDLEDTNHIFQTSQLVLSAMRHAMGLSELPHQRRQDVGKTGEYQSQGSAST